MMPQPYPSSCPAFRAAHILPRVLAPLMAMQARGEVAEVIVVDDRRRTARPRSRAVWAHAC